MAGRSISAVETTAGLHGWRWRGPLVLSALLGLTPAPARALDQQQFFVAATRLGVQRQAQALLQTIERATKLDEDARVPLLNDYINARIDFQADHDVWGAEDYWASPLETLAKGRGDCEDYAITKYFSLLAAGVPEARLRMVYVRAQLDGRPQAHMVLAYYAQPDAPPLILDNIDAALKPASQRPDLSPVFSFNTEGLWQGVGAVTAGNPLARLSLWRALVAKVRAEGF